MPFDGRYPPACPSLPALEARLGSQSDDPVRQAVAASPGIFPRLSAGAEACAETSDSIVSLLKVSIFRVIMKEII